MKLNNNLSPLLSSNPLINQLFRQNHDRSKTYKMKYIKLLICSWCFWINICYADNFYVGVDLGGLSFQGTSKIGTPDGSVFIGISTSSSLNTVVSKEIKVGYLPKTYSNWRYGIEASTVLTPAASANNKYLYKGSIYYQPMYMKETLRQQEIKLTTLLDYHITPKFFGRMLGGIEFLKTNLQGDVDDEVVYRKKTVSVAPYTGIGLRYLFFKKVDIGFSYNYVFGRGKFRNSRYATIGFNYNFER